MKKPEEFSVKQLLELFDNGSINVEQLNHLVRELRSAAHEQVPDAFMVFDENGEFVNCVLNKRGLALPQDARYVPYWTHPLTQTQQFFSTQEEFSADQWWVKELYEATKKGSPDQQRAYAVVLSLLSQVRQLNPVPAKQPPIGAHDGFAVVEAALKRVSSGNLAEAPFPLTGSEAKCWLNGAATAYQHALEMIVPVQSPAVAVPDGWKLVPKTPTHEMLLASAKAAPTEGPDLTPRSSWTQWAPNARWAAMLNAAPVPPIIAEPAIAVPDLVYCSNETALKPEVKKHLESLIALRKEMNGEESRAQFHAWADEHGFCMDEVWSSVDEPFENEDTQLAWLIWQASRAVISAQSPRITEQELREIAGSVLGPLQLATMTNIDQWFEREGRFIQRKLNGVHQ